MSAFPLAPDALSAILGDDAMRLYLALILLMALASTAPGHHAPSGFAHPSECCKGSDIGGDCKPIPADDVHENGDGSYTIIAFKEVFYQPGTAPVIPNYSLEAGITHIRGKQWQVSPDGQFHRCFMDINEPAAGTHCLYVVPPGT